MKKLTAVLLSLLLVLSAVVPALAEGETKDETVYVIATADGEARKVIVSDWLTNPDGAGTLADVSTLAGVENVKGDETFDGTVWAANGRDIYYQGTSEETLPVELKITYTLDGEALTAAEIAGKSGRATIRFDYTLTDAARIEGAQARYIPFAVVTGALLAFTLSLDDFTISYFTTSPLVQNLSTLIYSATKLGISPVYYALSSLMFVVLLVLLMIVNHRTADNN